MVGGVKKINLDLPTILSKISEYDIYRYYIGHDFDLGRKFNSPFRKDNNPSFCVDDKESGLKFIDFGNDQYHGGVIDFVMMLHPATSYHDALALIDRDMGLGIRNKETGKDYKKIIKDYRPPAEIERKCDLKLIKRSYTQEELAYWNEFHQSEDDLRRLKIWSVGKLFMNQKRFSLNPNELRFAYEYGPDVYKLYRPFADKDEKFFPNNTPITEMDGWGLFEDDTLVEYVPVAKSRKDFAVMCKVLEYVLGVQNEGTGCFSEENVKKIKKHAKKVYIAFDSDAPGKLASMRVTTKFGFNHINVPDKYLAEGIKDFAEFGRVKGLDALSDYFKEKGLK